MPNMKTLSKRKIQKKTFSKKTLLKEALTIIMLILSLLIYTEIGLTYFTGYGIIDNIAKIYFMHEIKNYEFLDIAELNAYSCEDLDMSSYIENIEKSDAEPSVIIRAYGTCGDKFGQDELKWEYCSNTLYISGTGRMENFEHCTPWCDFSEDIEKVIVEDGCKCISLVAFWNCSNMKTLELYKGTDIGTRGGLKPHYEIIRKTPN